MDKSVPSWSSNSKMDEEYGVLLIKISYMFFVYLYRSERFYIFIRKHLFFSRYKENEWNWWSMAV